MSDIQGRCNLSSLRRWRRRESGGKTHSVFGRSSARFRRNVPPGVAHPNPWACCVRVDVTVLQAAERERAAGGGRAKWRGARARVLPTRNPNSSQTPAAARGSQQGSRQVPVKGSPRCSITVIQLTVVKRKHSSSPRRWAGGSASARGQIGGSGARFAPTRSAGPVERGRTPPLPDHLGAQGGGSHTSRRQPWLAVLRSGGLSCASSAEGSRHAGRALPLGDRRAAEHAPSAKHPGQACLPMDRAAVAEWW